MKKSILIFIAIIQSVVSFGVIDSKDTIPIVDSTNSEYKTGFLILPLFGYAQETRFRYGISGLVSILPKHSDSSTRVSNLFVGATYSQNKQLSLNTYSNIWTNNNIYHYVIDASYNDFPDRFYGIGSSTKFADEDFIKDKRSKFFLEAERRFGKKIYLGLSILLQRNRIEDLGERGIYQSIPNLIGKTGGRVNFNGASIIYDTRDSYTYAEKGSYYKLQVSQSLKGFLSNYTLTRIEFQTRNFFTVRKRDVIGIHSVYKTLQGDSTLFYLMPPMGGDLIMRGYFLGRYRDQNSLAAQVEYRYRPFTYLALVGFAGLGSVYKNGAFAMQEIKPTIGLGTRLFFDLRNRLTLRIDYGFGEKPVNEKRIQGLYISISEAF